MTGRLETTPRETGIEEAPLFLSICIPTYNRSRFLDETLYSVEASLRGVEVPVELVVSDNASSDDTAEVLETWRPRFLNSKIHRHPENIGAEANFASLIQAAAGRYVWLLGDDDKISPDFFRRIIDVLQTNPDAVICNYSVHSADYSFVHNPAFFRAGESGQICSRSDALARFGVGAGFISAIVFKGISLRRIDSREYSKYSPFGLSFFYAVYAMLPDKCRVEFIAEPLVYCRGGNSNVDWEKVFLDGVAEVMRGFLAIGFSKTSIIRAKNMAVRDYVLQRLGTLKVSGDYTGGFLRRCFNAYRECYSFWCFILPMALLPSSALRIIKKLRNRNGKN